LLDDIVKAFDDDGEVAQLGFHSRSPSSSIISKRDLIPILCKPTLAQLRVCLCTFIDALPADEASWVSLPALLQDAEQLQLGVCLSSIDSEVCHFVLGQAKSEWWSCHAFASTKFFVIARTSKVKLVEAIKAGSAIALLRSMAAIQIDDEAVQSQRVAAGHVSVKNILPYMNGDSFKVWWAAVIAAYPHIVPYRDISFRQAGPVLAAELVFGSASAAQDVLELGGGSLVMVDASSQATAAVEFLVGERISRIEPRAGVSFVDSKRAVAAANMFMVSTSIPQGDEISELLISKLVAKGVRQSSAAQPQGLQMMLGQQGFGMLGVGNLKLQSSPPPQVESLLNMLKELVKVAGDMFSGVPLNMLILGCMASNEGFFPFSMGRVADLPSSAVGFACVNGSGLLSLKSSNTSIQMVPGDFVVLDRPTVSFAIPSNRPSSEPFILIVFTKFNKVRAMATDRIAHAPEAIPRKGKGKGGKGKGGKSPDKGKDGRSSGPGKKGKGGKGAGEATRSPPSSEVRRVSPAGKLGGNVSPSRPSPKARPGNPDRERTPRLAASRVAVPTTAAIVPVPPLPQ
jgi:hypothetical protein